MKNILRIALLLTLSSFLVAAVESIRSFEVAKFVKIESVTSTSSPDTSDYGTHYTSTPQNTSEEYSETITNTLDALPDLDVVGVDLEKLKELERLFFG